MRNWFVVCIECADDKTMISSDSLVRLPNEICDLAKRLGVRSDATGSMVTLTQVGEMRDPPATRWMKFTARQTISVDRSDFRWRARAGPLGCVTVVDALDRGQGELSVKLFGMIPLTRVTGVKAVIQGELMRYLAELPFSPDAIVNNRELTWSIWSETIFTVGVGDVTIDIELDAEGRIGSVRADRPRKEGSAFVTRPWRGRLFDYRRTGDRWIPHAADVGWVLNGGLQIAWRGSIIDWKMS